MTNSEKKFTRNMSRESPKIRGNTIDYQKSGKVKFIMHDYIKNY